MHTKFTTIIPRICAYCGKEFTPPRYSNARYCTISCSVKQRHANGWVSIQRADAQRKCEQCGKEFILDTPGSDKRFCSKACTDDWRRLNPSVGRIQKPRPKHYDLTEKEIERWWSKVDKSAGPLACWPWTGAMFNDGYGQFKLKGVGPIQAHIIGWAIAHEGNLPEGKLELRHTCDNRRCVNLEHMLIGTDNDNKRDMVERGRSDKNRSERSKRKLTEETAYEVHELFAAGWSLDSIAEKFGIWRGTVKSVLRGSTWKEAYEAFIFNGGSHEFSN